MRKLIIMLGMFLAITSCESEGELTKDPVAVTPPSTGEKYSGNFISSPGESVSGSASIYLNNKNQLILDKVVTAGPDLKVYLSKSDKPDDYVNLGSFVNTKTTYVIPESVDVMAYSYVIIYCQQYSVIFGVAKLTKP